MQKNRESKAKVIAFISLFIPFYFKVISYLVVLEIHALYFVLFWVVTQVLSLDLFPLEPIVVSLCLLESVVSLVLKSPAIKGE